LLDLVPDAGSVPSGLTRDDWARLPTNVYPASPEAADRRYASGNAMQLSADQLLDFDEQGYLFFPNCFSEEEIALLRDDAEAILKRYGGRRPARRPPPSPPTPSTIPSACWPRTRGWSSRCASCSARTSTCISLSSTPRPHSRAMSGSGIRTTAPGRATMVCRKPAP